MLGDLWFLTPVVKWNNVLVFFWQRRKRNLICKKKKACAIILCHFIRYQNVGCSEIDFCLRSRTYVNCRSVNRYLLVYQVLFKECGIILCILDEMFKFCINAKVYHELGQKQEDSLQLFCSWVCTVLEEALPPEDKFY